MSQTRQLSALSTSTKNIPFSSFLTPSTHPHNNQGKEEVPVSAIFTDMFLII